MSNFGDVSHGDIGSTDQFVDMGCSFKVAIKHYS